MRLSALQLLLALTPALQAQLVRDWHTIQTPHFEAVSRYDPARLSPLLTELEWCYGVFEQNLGLESRKGRGALLLIPDSPFEYEQMSPAKYAGGYYQGAPWRDMIVMRDLFDARHTLFHELSHLVMHHEGGRYPLWFNEGTAEYFAEMRAVQANVEAGQPERRRIAILKTGAWVPPAYLTTLANAGELNSTDAVHRFYVQSWLYVHMLRLSPAYADMFPKFRAALKEGASTEQVLQQVYGKTLTQFDNDAREWFRAPQWLVERLKPPPAPAAAFATNVASEVEVELAIALASAGKNHAAPSRATYNRLAAQASQECRHQAALGDLAFASRLMSEASQHYRRAIDCGADISTLAAGLESTFVQRQNIPPAELEQVVKLTGSVRSKYLLGVAQFFDNDAAASVETLKGITGLSHSEQFRASRVRALGLYKLDRHEEAIEEAKRLMAMADSVDERQTAVLTLQDVERDRSRAETRKLPMHEALLRSLTRIDGEVIRVDCLGERARFWVRSGTSTTKLIIADPSEVVSGGEGAGQLEFSCGTQKRPVTVGYVEAPDSATGTSGRIRYLVFR